MDTVVGTKSQEDKFRNADVEMSDGDEDDKFRNADTELKEDPTIIK